MTDLTFDRARALLPDVEELGPLLDLMLRTARPDEARVWSGSGELGTAGDRLVDPAALVAGSQALAADEHAHRSEVYRLTALALARFQEDDRDGAANALLEVAALEEGRDHHGRAALYADRAYAIARDGAAPEVVLRALRRRARGRWRSGRYGDAERDYAEAFESSAGTRDRRGAAEAAIGAGNVVWDQGRWSDAAAWYRRGLEALSHLEVVTPERWHALLNLHVTMRSAGRLQESLAPLEEAETIAAELGDTSASQFTENARGQWLMARGDFEAAIARLRNALEASSSSRAAVTIRLNLAEALLAAGRVGEAAEEARRAERDALTGRVPGRLPEVYRLLGRIAAETGNPDAFVLFERALEIAAERNLPELERALTLDAYARAEERVGSASTSKELHANAAEIFARLGITHPRSEWADQYPSEPGSTDDETTESRDGIR
jgi:tetratricopeptide (TPR) repeat protein